MSTPTTMPFETIRADIQARITQLRTTIQERLSNLPLPFQNIPWLQPPTETATQRVRLMNRPRLLGQLGKQRSPSQLRPFNFPGIVSRVRGQRRGNTRTRAQPRTRTLPPTPQDILGKKKIATQSLKPLNMSVEL